MVPCTRDAAVNDPMYVLSPKSDFLKSEFGQLSVRQTLILVLTVSVLERVDCTPLQLKQNFRNWPTYLVFSCFLFRE